jgi:hypothetical protein
LTGTTTRRSGWLGIEYGEPSHGFVDLVIGGDGGARATIHRLGSDGEVYSTFRLSHDSEHRRVDLLENIGEDFALDDDDEPDPESGWNVDASAPVPAHLAAPLSATDAPERVFAAMASLHAWMFTILDNGTDLNWDHHWFPGPDPDQLWRPVPLGSESSPFATRSSPPPAAPAS